jgi:transposase
VRRRYVLAFFEKLAPCLVGIEACAASHHWSRQLQALGHTVRLMPPAYVKPYVKRQVILNPTFGDSSQRPRAAIDHSIPSSASLVDNLPHRDRIRADLDGTFGTYTSRAGTPRQAGGSNRPSRFSSLQARTS